MADVSGGKTISSYRKKNKGSPILAYFVAALKNPKSLFYFVLALILLGFLWSMYGLVDNSFSSAFNWDYSHQYLPFAYHYHDCWRTFFTTFQFPLYSEATFIGSDNIGSNTYYGLFDPFIILMSFFPRFWIPQLFAMATIAKCTLAAVFMRMFLKYRGIKEWTARLGAVALAFSGYLNFMVGFPSFVSALTYVPLILYGIERVLREQKPGPLIFGLFLMELSCFMLLVTMCIWGVIYSAWRFFATFKTRNARQNAIAIACGVCGFAIGILLGAWALLPSLRESSLSGRTSSIGSAYMHSLFDAVKSRDIFALFTRLFEEVGDNPGRELMGLVSFFYPTGGFISLPLVIVKSTGSIYDAWTASIFCYTPFIILFFSGLIHSILQKRFDHLIAVAGCVLLVFSTFAYYFFFAFSGNGYGRWMFVLIPEIIIYGCWAFDQRKTGPRWVPLASSVIALVGSILAYFAIIWVLKGKSFSGAENGMTYYYNKYLIPTDDYEGLLRQWYLYYEMGMIFIEGVIFFAGYRKKFLPHVFLALLACEVVLVGNTAFFYIGTWPIETTFMGGDAWFKHYKWVTDNIESYEKGFHRVYMDSSGGTENYHYAMGTNESASFHSLLNFATNDFSNMNGMKYVDYGSTTYGGEEYVNISWTSAYRNKRMGIDTTLGFRYYVVEHNSDRRIWIGENVPFGAEELPDFSGDRNVYRVYRISEDYVPQLGHAVDPEKLYRLGIDETGTQSNFYGSASNSAAYMRDQRKAQEIELLGAVIDDDAELPEGFIVQDEPPSSISDSAFEANYGMKRMTIGSGMTAQIYMSDEKDRILPNSEAAYADEGAGYFFLNNIGVEAINSGGMKDVRSGVDHIVLRPSGSEYFNSDIRGGYFEFKYYNNYYSYDNYHSKFVPRIIVFGDQQQEDGTILENQVLAYEGRTLKNVVEIDRGDWRNSTIGLYPRGRAKAIALIWPEWWSNGEPELHKFSTSTVSMFVEDYPVLEQKFNFLKENALLNVQKFTNHYTFETDYDKDSLVVTQLGYDAGWSCEAKLEDGSTVKCPMYRLDGGLVGFVAPKGNNSYKLKYATPYGLLGLLAALGGLAVFAGYFAFERVSAKRKKQE